MKNLISESFISMQIQPEIGEYNAIFISPFSVVLHYRPLPAMMAHVSAATGLAYEPVGRQYYRARRSAESWCSQPTGSVATWPHLY